jgi:hypothetical protein
MGGNLFLESDMAENNMIVMNKWRWWVKGECVVEILGIGHFPTTVMAKLPNDQVTEIDMHELENTEDT